MMPVHCVAMPSHLLSLLSLVCLHTFNKLIYLFPYNLLLQGLLHQQRWCTDTKIVCSCSFQNPPQPSTCQDLRFSLESLHFKAIQRIFEQWHLHSKDSCVVRGEAAKIFRLGTISWRTDQLCWSAYSMGRAKVLLVGIQSNSLAA